MRIPGLRRWAAVVASAAAVAAATGLFYLALAIPLSEPRWDDLADRRPARPTLRPDRVEFPLERLSKHHVAVEAFATVRGADAGGSAQRPVRVLLDTGQSVAITTPMGERAFALRAGSGRSIVGRGISDGAMQLLPIQESQTLFVSVAPFASPNSVAAPVRHLGVDLLEGAHVILPPLLLGPYGGAVELDLVRNRFATCESLAACRAGAEWTTVNGAPCPSHPDLAVMSASLGGAPARLLLDTGGVTLVGPRFFDAASLGARGTVRSGSLVASGGKSLDVRVVTGDYALELGADRSLSRTVHTLWVPTELAGVIARCNLDGAVGIDALDGCRIVLGGTTQTEAFVSCP